MDCSNPSDESRVLVIYTGGTIGMLVGPQGYRNEPHFLTETLRCQSRFHDPLEDSLFSHSGTIEGFRKWTTSGKSSPVSDSFTSSLTEIPTLMVKSTRPISSPFLSDPRNRTSPEVVQCKKIDETTYECHLPSLVTPRTSIHSGNTKRIRYAILEWNPLLDSSNVDTADWVRIATEIELNYSAFDAFVILHGTDTMAYTASALSFMLEDLGKTVILTGAQIPLSQLRNDAVDNLLGALSIAGQYIIPECCVFFNQCLYRGNRVSKVSSYDLDAFNSPNLPPLVNVGIDIVVNWNNVIRQTSLRRFKAYKKMDSHVATLRLFPGISAEIVRAFLKPPIQGVVLETFGAGNAPQRSDLMEALKEASDRCVIVAITQCSKGTVSDAYETGRALLSIGIVPGGDMTPECALTKLSYLLSKPELSLEKVRELIRVPLRGELTIAGGNSGSHNAKLSMDKHLDIMHDCLSQMLRLASNTRSPHLPEIVVSSVRSTERDLALAATATTTSSTPTTTSSSLASSSSTTAPTPASSIPAAAAPWSLTAEEASKTESSLFPILIRMATSRDDVEGLEFCLNYQSESAAGIVNSVDPSSGWSPLHVAAFNGSQKCLDILLHAGALVHLRDALGHTALYYAARRGHTKIVEILRQAGADLGGSDLEGGYASLEVTKAIQRGDSASLELWQKAGFNIQSVTNAPSIPCELDVQKA